MLWCGGSNRAGRNEVSGVILVRKDSIPAADIEGGVRD